VGLDDTKRSAVIVGVIYFCSYLLTSYASKSSAEFGRRLKSIAQGINLTFLVGAVFLFVAGLAAR
jgi:hypothetical protein